MFPHTPGRFFEATRTPLDSVDICTSAAPPAAAGDGDDDAGASRRLRSATERCARPETDSALRAATRAAMPVPVLRCS